jgi:segregation and condensation protein B
MEDLETPLTEPIEAAEAPESSAGLPACEPETAGPDSTGETACAPTDSPEEPTLSMEDLLSASEPAPASVPLEDAQLRAVLEAIIYVSEEPLTLAQLAASLQQPAEQIHALLDQLIAEFDKPEHGVAIREVAGGYKMTTKPEHHEAVRNFVKSLKPPLKLSLPALETLAVIAYKQPVTAPEIMEIRGVQGAGVLKTLLDRKLIAVAGRKNVIGKPILYKTTKEFLIQFGLKDLSELPSLKEFEEIRRMAFSDDPAPETGAGGQGPGAGEDGPASSIPATAETAAAPIDAEAPAAAPQPATHTAEAPALTGESDTPAPDPAPTPVEKS